MRWLWWLLGIGVAGGAVYLISSSTGKPVVATKACIIDLPDPFKSSAQKAIAASDVGAMTTLAAQAERSGWTCAGKQLRDAILSGKQLRDAILRARRATAGIDEVPDPPRSAWQKLIDRALGEAKPAGDLVTSLEAASVAAGETGYAKVRDLLHDAARDVRKTMRIADVTEEPPARDVAIALAGIGGGIGGVLAKKGKMDPIVLEALAKQLDGLGYSGAAIEARAMAIAATTPTPIMKHSETAFEAATAIESGPSMKKKLGGTEDSPVATASPDVTASSVGPEFDTLPQYPEDVRGYARGVWDSTSHDLAGWKTGGAVMWKKLSDGGYKTVADEVIATYLPEA